MINLKRTSNQDGFEKFLRKLCVAPSGQGNLPLENARWLLQSSQNLGENWPELVNPRLESTATGKKLKAYLAHGISFEGGDNTFIREFLADLAIWGFRNKKLQSLGEMS